MTVVVLPGDGIGPEVMAEALRALDALGGLELAELPFGAGAIRAHGDPLPPETLLACRGAEAILKGPVGDPEFDAADVRPEQGIIRLRRELDVYANLRPARDGRADLLIVRELVGGLYYGPRGVREDGTAFDTCEYHPREVERIARRAFGLAQGRRRRVTSDDKANVLETSRLWREVVGRVVAEEFPEVRLDHLLVDACAMRLVQAPSSFDVIVTENMFGDILTDEAAVLSASIGLLPSASIGDGKRGLYEPIHGSAPDIAGQAIANPVGTILSVAMMLRFSLGLEQEAQCIERAVEDALRDGARTRDVGGTLTTHAMGGAIRERLEEAAAGGSTSAMLSRAF